jgi:3-dehydroquinate dehydratase II
LIYVLNGPNLGRLGTREPAVYGTTTYADLVSLCRSTASDLGVEVDVRQTDAEHEMLGWLHTAADEGADVVLNPAAWTHYNIAVRDACGMLTGRLSRCTSRTSTRANRSGIIRSSRPWPPV